MKFILLAVFLSNAVCVLSETVDYKLNEKLALNYKQLKQYEKDVRRSLLITSTLEVLGLPVTIICSAAPSVAFTLFYFGLAVYMTRDYLVKEYKMLKQRKELEPEEKKEEPISQFLTLNKKKYIEETKEVVISIENETAEVQINESHILLEFNQTFQNRARDITRFLKDQIYIDVSDEKTAKNYSEKLQIKFEDFDHKQIKADKKEIVKEKKRMKKALTNEDYVYSDYLRALVDFEKQFLAKIFAKEDYSSKENGYKTVADEKHHYKKNMHEEDRLKEEDEDHSTLNQHKNVYFQLLSQTLISKARNYFESVNEICLQYILLVRMMPAYKDSGAAPEPCLEDYMSYEWLAQMEVMILFDLPKEHRKLLLEQYKHRHHEMTVQQIKERAKYYNVPLDSVYYIEQDKTYLTVADEEGDRAQQILNMVSSLDPYLDNSFYRKEEAFKSRRSTTDKRHPNYYRNQLGKEHLAG